MSDPAALLAQGLPGVFGAGAVVSGLKRLSGGASQETWAFELQQGGASRALILRRAPAGHRQRGSDGPGLAAEAELIRQSAAAGAPAPEVVAVLQPGHGQIICLIKPQFELTREDVGRGGIVRDPALHQRAVDKIRLFIEEHTLLQWKGVMESPIKGTDGNVEFLAWIGPA